MFLLHLLIMHMVVSCLCGSNWSQFRGLIGSTGFTLKGSDPRRCKVRAVGSVAPVTPVWHLKSLDTRNAAFRPDAYVQTYRFVAHYDAGDADERWEWAHRLRRLLDLSVSLSLSFFFIRLFQTLNVPLYNSSQALHLPWVSGSSLGEETATYKGRSAPQPTI